MAQNKKTQLILRRAAELSDLYRFLLERVTDAGPLDHVYTYHLYDFYRAWRAEQDMPPTAFSLRGFGKAVPLKRKRISAGDEGGPNRAYHWGIIGKRMV